MTQLHNTAALLREDATTVLIRHSKHGREYIYRVLKSLATQIQPEDIVVVGNQHGIILGTVVEVHDEPQIDPQASYQYRWAFQKINKDQLEYLDCQDETLVRKLQALQRQRFKAQALSALGINPDELPKLLIQDE